MREETLSNLLSPIGKYRQVALDHDGRILLVEAVNGEVSTVDVVDYFRQEHTISNGTQARMYMDIWDALKPHMKTPSTNA